MPLYIALAAMFFPDRPVRLANNRYEQFQSGIKRHAFKMRSRIGIDRATGKIRAFAADHRLDGGGLANYSGNVAQVAAMASIGIYDIPNVDINTVVVHSRGVTARSMRCYGIVQTMTALEMLIDETATALRVDPIEFRRSNALPHRRQDPGRQSWTASRARREILDKLAQHPIWAEHAREGAHQQQGDPGRHRRRLRHQGFRLGRRRHVVPRRDRDDGRIIDRSDAVEMGTAIGTALAIARGDHRRRRR